MTKSAAPSPEAKATLLPLMPQSGFGLITLRSASPLTLQLLPTGALYAIRHQNTLVNQVLPGPAEQGLFRLYVRERNEGEVVGSTAVAGPGLAFSHSADAATWRTPVGAASDVRCTTTVRLHPRQTAWRWQVQLHNTGAATRRFDVVLGQDLGLGDEAAVRNNEAYASQYVDFLPVHDVRRGWAVLARQNQPMQGGKHPWLALSCAQGAVAYCTDGAQFFGSDHRLTGRPAAERLARLPSRRVQYECALVGLQGPVLELPPGASVVVGFAASFVEDHPAPSIPEDAAAVDGLFADVPEEPPMPETMADRAEAPLFVAAGRSHGDEPTAADLAAWFPGQHREVERDSTGRVLAFFCGENMHVATRMKEAAVTRPHGHVLRNGDGTWIDDGQFGFTAYAAGIFSAQSYLGNPSLARLLPVIRDALGVIRASGQRVFIRTTGEWTQLGIPSAFALTPGEVCWTYRFGSTVLQVRAWCSPRLAASYLDLQISAGASAEFLITHELALGGNEFDHGGAVQVRAEEGWASCALDRDSFTARRLPGTCFAIAALGSDALEIGGDELVYPDAQRRHGPYLVFRFGATCHCGVAQLGSGTGASALPALVSEVRAEYARRERPATPAPLGLRLGGTADAGVARLNEVLPWFNHNAAIHFSAPHGLEQYGGAAWGVRDVCQGSLEWLLAGARFDVVRHMLTTVFAQQYHTTEPPEVALSGSWPQWFMFQPFQTIQQAHSHGDVCFWPVKALCDYVEATGDFRFMATPVGYTSPRTFAPVSPLESLWQHCDRVISHVESRFVPGTGLVNYGDGDWDDTLQPADPAMRDRMISAWTVALAYHAFRQLAEVCRRANETGRAARLQALLTRMRRDFAAKLLLDGVVAGFLITEADGTTRPLLHPRDEATHIRYRLLPMTRSILAELFTPEEAQRHLAIIEAELRYPDGVRLMSEPAAYHGGSERLFKRAETAANVGREIGLQYVHAHLRYAEALAKVGDADQLWIALQTVNPVGLVATVPNAALRQSNVYFSSSDADFADRYEANARWSELRTGRVPVRAGWRLYSSGPGLFLHKVRSCLLGIREAFGDVVFDPVLPRRLDGLTATLSLGGVAVEIRYHVRTATHAPSSVSLNGVVLEAVRDANPYRTGGLRVSASLLASRLRPADNVIEVAL